MFLVRVLIGKVEDVGRLQSNFRSTQVRPGVPGWNCVAWLKEALKSVVRDGGGPGTAIKEWDSILDTAIWYVATKRAEHRFDGSVKYDTSRAATWDMLEGKELIP
ncbi:hypothetical protein DL765_000657 [Monosporascus sp. GIB2]|nr:hypothetical protein DL765_000657 [Monosporascus sp. GIB2]